MKPAAEIANDGRSTEPADLLFGHHAFDILGLALDAVARASIGLDRQTGDDGVHATLLDDGTALRTLKLVMDVIVDREIMGHRRSSCYREGLLIAATQKRNKIRGLTCGFG